MAKRIKKQTQVYLIRENISAKKQMSFVGYTNKQEAIEYAEEDQEIYVADNLRLLGKVKKGIEEK